VPEDEGLGQHTISVTHVEAEDSVTFAIVNDRLEARVAETEDEWQATSEMSFCSGTEYEFRLVIDAGPEDEVSADSYQWYVDKWVHDRIGGVGDLSVFAGPAKSFCLVLGETSSTFTHAFEQPGSRKVGCRFKHGKQTFERQVTILTEPIPWNGLCGAGSGEEVCFRLPPPLTPEQVEGIMGVKEVVVWQYSGANNNLRVHAKRFPITAAMPMGEDGWHCILWPGLTDDAGKSTFTYNYGVTGFREPAFYPRLGVWGSVYLIDQYKQPSLQRGGALGDEYYVLIAPDGKIPEEDRIVKLYGAWAYSKVPGDVVEVLVPGDELIKNITYVNDAQGRATEIIVELTDEEVDPCESVTLQFYPRPDLPVGAEYPTTVHRDIKFIAFDVCSLIELSNEDNPVAGGPRKDACYCCAGTGWDVTEPDGYDLVRPDMPPSNEGALRAGFQEDMERTRQAIITVKVNVPVYQKGRVLEALSLAAVGYKGVSLVWLRPAAEGADPVVYRPGLGSVRQDEQDRSKWVYEPFEELQTAIMSSAKSPASDVRVEVAAVWKGQECGKSIEAVVVPVFRFLTVWGASGRAGALSVFDYDLAWRYAKSKCQTDTSELNSIYYNPSLSIHGATQWRACWLGPLALECESVCASTLGHENVHGPQSPLMPEAEAEYPAYTWEAENAEETGITVAAPGYYTDVLEKQEYYRKQLEGP